MKNEQGENLINNIVSASVGTDAQHDIISKHMKDYFALWPNYYPKLTDLEWYHLFLDFLDAVKTNGPAVDLEKKKLHESIIHIASEGGFETLRDLIPLLAQRKQMCAEGRRHNVNDDYIADQLKVYNDKIKYILNL